MRWPLILVLLSFRYAKTWSWIGSKVSEIQTSKFKSVHCNFLKASYCPIALKAAGKHGQVNASLMPSWIVPTRLQRIFSKKVPVEPDGPDPRFFFNRDIEIAELKSILNGPPSCSIMLGPPSTGKTQLMDRVLSSVKVDGTRLNINLRGASLDTGELFWGHVESNSRIASAADKAWKMFADTASKIQLLKIPKSGREVGLQESKIQNSNVLESLANSVPVWQGGSDSSIVIVIDEANALKKLAKNDYLLSLRFEHRSGCV